MKKQYISSIIKNHKIKKKKIDDDPLTCSHKTKFGLDQIKSIADYKLHVKIVIVSAFDRVENILGKGEITCITLSQTSLGFYVSVFARLLKTLWEK